MSDPKQIISLLEEEFRSWEEMLAGLSEGQLSAPQLPANLSIKDVVAHLMAWQQVSIARLQAAQLNNEPLFPAWLAGLEPESEKNLDQFNARIYETYRQQPWARVHAEWRDGFLNFLQLAKEIPESDISDSKKYSWLNGYSLIAVLQGSYEHHHHDHLNPLRDWLRQHGQLKTGS